MFLPSLQDFQAATRPKYGIALRRHSGLKKIDVLLKQWEHNQHSSRAAKIDILNRLCDRVEEFGAGYNLASSGGHLRFKHTRDRSGIVFGLTHQAQREIIELYRVQDAAQTNIAPAPIQPPQPAIATEYLGRPANAAVAPVRYGTHKPPIKLPVPPSNWPTDKESTIDEDANRLSSTKSIAYKTQSLKMFLQQGGAVTASENQLKKAIDKASLNVNSIDDNALQLCARALADMNVAVDYGHPNSLERVMNVMRRSSVNAPVLVVVGAPDEKHNIAVLVKGTQTFREITGIQYHGLRVADPRPGYQTAEMYQNGIYTVHTIVGGDETYQVIPEFGYIAFHHR